MDTPLAAWTRSLEWIAPLQSRDGPTIASSIADAADGARPALLSRSETLTIGELAARAYGFGCWAVEQALAPGESVCLLMPNRPEYVAIWAGITGVRGVVALLNNSLLGHALLHAIEAAAPRHLIVDARLETRLMTIRDQLPPTLQIWAHGPSHRWPRIDDYVRSIRVPNPLPRPIARLCDPALLIYTSGTTGLPKAATVSHRRVMEWSCWSAGMLNAQPTDRLYDCLPMYHSVGGVVAIGAMIVAGGSVFIRERFSSQQFWDDIVDENCTIFQYIGELCRYLLAAPPHARASAHNLRVCFGNGLRGDVWMEFRRRFRIPKILEFYAATEGNISLYNCEGKAGSIGRIPPFLRHRFPITLVRIDPLSGHPLRGTDGLCIKCEIGEVGEALGRIALAGAENGRPFEGYTDPHASERKILHDVASRGDAWFRTGDLMRCDAAGFFYFVDRLGDTFRWKGENVSTEQVAAAIRSYEGIEDAIVYGVLIPGTEGRAGMAAVIARANFDRAELRRTMVELLPQYAHPLFLRICRSLPTTGTYKPLKVGLARAGFDPAQVHDPLYFNDHTTGTFLPLDRALHARIVSGEVRL